MIVVVEVNQVVELEVPGERRGFGGNSFHKATVARDSVNLEVDDVVSRAVEMRREMLLCDPHSHAVPESLPQRSGGRFNSRNQPVLRMSRRLASPLTELLKLRHRHVVTRQMQQAVKQHRTVPRGQNE